VTESTAPNVLRPTGRLLIRNSLFNLAGQVLPFVAAITSIPVLVKRLAPTQFGLLSFIWVVLSYLTVFDFGLSRGMTKLVSEAMGQNDEARVRELIPTTLAMQTMLGLVVMVVGIGFSGLVVRAMLDVPRSFQREASSIMVALAVCVPLILVYNGLRAVLESFQRFDLVNVVRAPTVAASYAVPAVVVALGYSVFTAVWALVGVRVAALIVALYQLGRILPSGARGGTVSGKSARAIARFSGWVAVSSVVSPTVVYLDRLVLGALLPVGALGRYSIAHESITRVSVIPASVASTLFPAFSSMDAAGDRARLQRLMARSLTMLLLVVGPITLTLAILAPTLLRVWVGASVAVEVTTAFRILAAGALINSVAYLPYMLLLAVGRPDITAKLHLAELALQAVLAFALVSNFGLTGAALAWTIRVAIDTALMFGLAMKFTPVNMSLFSSRGLQRALLFTAMAGLVAILARNLPATWQAIVASAIVIAGLLTGWYWILQVEDKDHLLRALVGVQKGMGGKRVTESDRAP
jgi:O-antigen/teichoic acid export membrane protein